MSFLYILYLGFFIYIFFEDTKVQNFFSESDTDRRQASSHHCGVRAALAAVAIAVPVALQLGAAVAIRVGSDPLVAVVLAARLCARARARGHAASPAPRNMVDQRQPQIAPARAVHVSKVGSPGTPAAGAGAGETAAGPRRPGRSRGSSRPASGRLDCGCAALWHRRPRGASPEHSPAWLPALRRRTCCWSRAASRAAQPSCSPPPPANSCSSANTGLDEGRRETLCVGGVEGRGGGVDVMNQVCMAARLWRHPRQSC